LSIIDQICSSYNKKLGAGGRIRYELHFPWFDDIRNERFVTSLFISMVFVGKEGETMFEILNSLQSKRVRSLRIPTDGARRSTSIEIAK